MFRCSACKALWRFIFGYAAFSPPKTLFYILFFFSKALEDFFYWKHLKLVSRDFGVDLADWFWGGTYYKGWGAMSTTFRLRHCSFWSMRSWTEAVSNPRILLNSSKLISLRSNLSLLSRKF